MFEQALASATPGSLPAVLGTLEKLKALAWARATDVVGSAEPTRAINPLDELRHLTPLQVAELLNLKEAYIHELCRSGRIPAIKEGKYWLIPLSGLREWLGHARQSVDPGLTGPLVLPDRPASLAMRSTNSLARTSATARGEVPTQARASSRRTAGRGDRTRAGGVATPARENVSVVKPGNDPELSAAPAGSRPAAP